MSMNKITMGGVLLVLGVTLDYSWERTEYSVVLVLFGCLHTWWGFVNRTRRAYRTNQYSDL